MDKDTKIWKKKLYLRQKRVKQIKLILNVILLFCFVFSLLFFIFCIHIQFLYCTLLVYFCILQDDCLIRRPISPFAITLLQFMNLY